MSRNFVVESTDGNIAIEAAIDETQKQQALRLSRWSSSQTACAAFFLQSIIIAVMVVLPLWSLKYCRHSSWRHF